MSAGVKAISGDRNPPGYSALNVEVDTIAGPVTIDKSVIGYVTQLEGMYILLIRFNGP